MIPQEVILDQFGTGVASCAAVPLIAAVESGNKDISFSVSEGLQPDLLRERLVQRAINGDRHFKFTVHESTTFRRQHTTSAGGAQRQTEGGDGDVTKEERAIIDKFLAKSKLQTECGRGTPIRSVADLEAFEEEKKFKSARVKRMTDLAVEYRHKIKREFWTGDADHMAQMVMHPGFRRNLWDYSDDEFEMLLRVARAILEGLARGFPKETDEKGA